MTTLRTSSIGRLFTVLPAVVDFEVTWSRGTMGLDAPTTVMPVTTTADDDILMLFVIVWPPNTRNSRTSVGANPMNWARMVYVPTGTLFIK